MDTAAAGQPNLTYLLNYSDAAIIFINSILVPLLMAVAFIVFLFGIYRYFIQGGDNEDSRTEGRKMAMNGIIGFVIILSIWGLVYLVSDTVGLQITNTPQPPTFNAQ